MSHDNGMEVMIVETGDNPRGADSRGEPQGGKAGLRPEASQLYMLRLWVGQGADGQNEWHGKLQHIVNGHAHHFRGWPSLVDLLTGLLPNAESLTPLEDNINGLAETEL
jgi:hypothetical protein